MTAVGASRRVYFPGFRFEKDSATLWRGDRPVALRPRTADVLACLVAQAGEVVTKRHLRDTVWPAGFVSEAALTVCISELRRALGDDARDPRYIATVHRRGYRFVPTVAALPVVRDEPIAADVLVGRDTELRRMAEWWDAARSARRQVVFVSGDVGLGKSTLVDAFAARASEAGRALVGRGQCIEHAGEGEPYLAVFEALAALCHGRFGGLVRDALAVAAPTWLRHLPGLVSPAEHESLVRRTHGTTRAHMLRELADAVEAVTTEWPVLLVLEDLHHADPSTTDLVAYLAHRRRPAALMVVATYRPADATARAHPLVAVVKDLVARRTCRHLPLATLAAPAVEDYVTRRLAPAAPSPELTAEVHDRTGGHPLFLVAILDDLADHDLLEMVTGRVRSRDRLDRLRLPDTLLHLIGRQIDRADPDDRALLGAAAVAAVAAVSGIGFSTGAVAAALGDGTDLVDVEDRCRALAERTGLIARVGGSRADHYRFGHALHRDVIYEHHLTPARRARAHRRIAHHLVATHAPHTRHLAAELAVHFERGGDHDNAVVYLHQAAEAAAERSAPAEARDQPWVWSTRSAGAGGESSTPASA